MEVRKYLAPPSEVNWNGLHTSKRTSSKILMWWLCVSLEPFVWSIFRQSRCCKVHFGLSFLVGLEVHCAVTFFEGVGSRYIPRFYAIA